MAVLLGGGGDADDEGPVLDRFSALTGDSPIVYWPVALGLDTYTDAIEYATIALGRPVTTWTRLDDHRPEDVAAMSGVFIGGGNTFDLLAQVRRAGLESAVRERAKSGVVYGGSAGAILLGADIGTARYFDTNDADLDDFSGLGLIGAFAVWCHYVEEHKDSIRDWIADRDCPVIALSERSGAEVDDGVLTAVGYEPVRFFAVDGTNWTLPRGGSTSIS